MNSTRFVVMSDTHFFAPGNGKDGQWWNRTLHSRSQQIADAIIKTISKLKPEFIIHCGDFTGRCDMDNFAHGKKVMDQLGCPWYVVPGNHDTWYPGVREAFSSLYGLKSQQCFYSRLINDINFLFLDTTHWAAKDGTNSPYLDKELCDTGQIAGLYVPQHELDWLEEQLNSKKDKRAVLVSHAPIRFMDSYPLKKYFDGTAVSSEGFDISTIIDPLVNIEQVRNIIDGCPNIVAAFSGHWHINNIMVKDNTLFCQSSSLREWPFELRLVEIDDDTISITTHGLGDGELKKASYIEEMENDWIAGRDEDRSCIFKMNG